MAIAYLTSHYPAISHTFIQREIAATRKRGISIETYSIRTPPQSDPLSTTDTVEKQRTFYLFPLNKWKFLSSHVSALLQSPIGYFRRLYYSLCMAERSSKSKIFHLFYFLEAIYLQQQLVKKNISHVHVHFAMSCATVAMIACYKTHLSFSLTIHGPEIFQNPAAYKLKEKVEQARFVCCISNLGYKKVCGLVSLVHHHKVHVVRCGLDFRHFNNEVQPPQRNKLRLLNIARLSPRKGQERLIRAVAKLECVVESCVIVGGGGEFDRLSALIHELGVGDRVLLAGPVDQDRMLPYFNQADVFVLASDNEGVPVVLMEAMANYLPVIATNVGAVNELVKHGLSGWLVQSESVDELVNAIITFSKNQALRALFARNGRIEVESAFDINHSASQLECLFRKVV